MGSIGLAARHLGALRDHRETGSLLSIIYLTAMGTYLVIPFLALHVSRDPHVGTRLVGLLIALQVVTSRGLTVITGPVADRFGARRMLVGSVALLGLAYGALAFASGPWTYAVDLVAIGVGVAAFQPSMKSLLIRDTDPAARQRVFATRDIAFNAGVASGGAFGAIFDAHVTGLFIGAGIVYLLLSPVAWRVTARDEAERHHRSDAEGGRPAVHESLVQALRDRRLLLLVLVSAGFFFIYSQITITVPLTLAKNHLTHAVGLVFAANALLITACQMPLTRWADRLRATSATQLALGSLVSAAGLLVLCFLGFSRITDVAVTCAFVLLFTVGEMFAGPSIDTLTSNLASQHQLGTYFGVSYLGFALGAFLGNTVGGAVFQATASLAAPWPLWLICGALGGVVAVGTGAAARAGAFATPATLVREALP